LGRFFVAEMLVYLLKDDEIKGKKNKHVDYLTADTLLLNVNRIFFSQNFVIRI